MIAFTANYIVGTGFPTLPHAIMSTGLLLGSLVVAAAGAVGVAAADCVLESMARAVAVQEARRGGAHAAANAVLVQSGALEYGSVDVVSSPSGREGRRRRRPGGRAATSWAPPPPPPTPTPPSPYTSGGRKQRGIKTPDSMRWERAPGAANNQKWVVGSERVDMPRLCELFSAAVESSTTSRP